MRAYKAFDKDMKCKGFQFEEGKGYTHDKPIKICDSGFHACESPLDVLNYYNLCDSVFCEVEAVGNVEKKGNDTKICTDKIKIGLKLDLPQFIKAGIDFVFEKCKITETTSSGYYAWVECSGKNSIACGIGKNNRAKGIKGTWMVLSEINSDGIVETVKSVRVDGKKIKADTWYKLENKKFVIAE